MRILFIGEQILGPWEKMWADALLRNGHYVIYRNILEYNNNLTKIIGSVHYFFPEVQLKTRIKKVWDTRLNQLIFDLLNKDKFDLFFCYNEARLLPSTVDFIRKNVKKIAVLLGDNPFFYRWGKSDFLYLVEKADLLITADLAAINNLKMLNENVVFIPAGTDSTIFYPMELSKEDYDYYKSDVLFVGSQYGWNSFGYHRARILAEVAKLDIELKIFGNNGWKIFEKHFPSLKNKIIYKPLTQHELNLAQNASKIYLATTNPWLVNGIPTRVFDAISSGAFVLAEYREIYSELFPNGDISTFKNLAELTNLVQYYLVHENMRINKKNDARKFVMRNYTMDNNIHTLLRFIS